MKHFIGIKEVDAKPMTRGDYNKYRGWQIPADENPADEGYLVKYSDSYESWSPKVAFNEAYTEYNGTGLLSTVNDMRSQDYKKRFLAEYMQLELRLNSLRRMLDEYAAGELKFTPNCSYDLLHKQYVHMSDYLDDLDLRAVHEGINIHNYIAEEQE